MLQSVTSEPELKLKCESWKETKSEYWKIKNAKKQQILVENYLYITESVYYPSHV